MLNSLHVAQSGLSAARTSVEGVMNNISNENTPGYKKRIVELSESSQIDGNITGRGVVVGDVRRITSEHVYDNLLKENSTASYYDELSSRLADVESIFFETQDSGFSSDLDRYFQAMENLRSDPSNEVNKNNVINYSNLLVENIQNLYSGIEDLEAIGKNSVEDDIEIVNGILADIGKINEKIGQQIVPPNDLLDKRDALEEALSKYVDVDVDRTDNYELKIGGLTAVRYNTNVHNVSLVEVETPQIDKFTTDGTTNSFGTIDTDDIITYKLNNTTSASVTIGESITMDWNGDGSTTNEPVDANNYIRALAYRINTTTLMTGTVTAFNGNTQIDANGNEVSVDPTSDQFLVIKSNEDGNKGIFEGSIAITRMTGATEDSKSLVEKDDTYSEEATTDVQVQIFDGELTLKRGSIKAVVENLDSEDSLNKYNTYKEKLDSFVKAFVDIHESFVTQTDGTYLYGQKNVDSTTTGTATTIGMFSGLTVGSFKFNEGSMSSLTQGKLDYLATIQWKDDFDFDGSMQDGTSSTASSFSRFYQTLQVQVASDKENNDYLQDTQSAILNSLQGSYDKLVKVDKDEEMLNLIKFQSSYEANAKIVTVVDEMLATILGMKR